MVFGDSESLATDQVDLDVGYRSRNWPKLMLTDVEHVISACCSNTLAETLSKVGCSTRVVATHRRSSDIDLTRICAMRRRSFWTRMALIWCASTRGCKVVSTTFFSIDLAKVLLSGGDMRVGTAGV
ncbi:hypothetical protein BC936DRAFT_148835 [Jimgerdemannia flammicorona]|uniref:Uncharacterized protein n=1 Tax=Jimgerdemannia flammicorona TaxID=994334 RepID=A0A433DKD9_9FUNG|nr:hypothetical protein BC936DRAFT_148835 [Jimgerdemannia flammicorona]